MKIKISLKQISIGIIRIDDVCWHVPRGSERVIYIWLWYIYIYMLRYVNDMITLMVWCVRCYVCGRIREERDKRNVMIWLRHVHEMIWLGYV